MKKTLLTAVAFLLSVRYADAQSIVINNMSGCTIDYAVAGSTSPTACDFASDIQSIPPSTSYSYANPYDFENGIGVGPTDTRATSSASITGWPMTGWSWAWGEFRFTVDCGSGQCDVGAIGIPVSAWCSTPPASPWTWTPTGSCPITITGALANFSMGNVTFNFF